MRDVSKNKPEDPLKYLGEFLIQRSNQIENGETDTPASSITPHGNYNAKSNTEDDPPVKSEQDHWMLR